MSDIVIKAENVSKKYKIGHKQNNPTLRDAISGISNIFKPKPATEEFWALKDISFEVNQGDVVGIIGRNGSGKSTLLKILSRITEPTEGLITLKGRIASLLEVGTGFNPELTGRENIFLNGSILGMTRAEIRKHFDEIVDFSGVEKFLDTPVKRYSSGMYVRLAFAVSAHLESEILLIDEVLAVGDSQFQKKCLGKMKSLSKNGRTVLYVSHNLVSVQNLCKKSILLKNGQLLAYQNTDKVIDLYNRDINENKNLPISERTDREGTQNLMVQDVKVTNQNNDPIIYIGDELHITLNILNKTKLAQNATIGLTVMTESSSYLFSCSTALIDKKISLSKELNNWIKCIVPFPNLNKGTYFLNFSINSNNQLEDWIRMAASFTVEYRPFKNHKNVLEHPVLVEFKWDNISK